jgi:hypothetical protein
VAKNTLWIAGQCSLGEENYNKGERISHRKMGKLMITAQKTLPSWNCTPWLHQKCKEFLRGFLAKRVFPEIVWPCAIATLIGT